MTRDALRWSYWQVSSVGNCDSEVTAAVESKRVESRRPSPAYGSVAVIAISGRIRGGAGGLVGGAMDVGFPWIVQSHVEFSAGAHDAPDSVAPGIQPTSRFNVELGLAFPGGNTVWGPSVAVDTTFLFGAERYCDPLGLFCDGRDRAVSVGTLFTRGLRTHRDAYMSGFLGVGNISSSVTSGISSSWSSEAPLLRVRFEWGRPNGMFYGAEVTGPYDVTAVAGVHLR